MQETKVLTGGTGYDIVTPSNHNVPRYVAAKAIQPLDKTKLPNLKNLWPEVMKHMDPFDPGGTYTVPYMWGTIGLGYNQEAVAKRLPGVKIDSWDVVFKPENLSKLQDCGVYFLDASEDMYAVALHYLGKDPKIGRVVAIKTMALSQEFEGEELDDARERFFREAETAGRLQHQNIVTIFDAGEEHDLAYIAMEFLKGKDLADVTKDGSLLPVPKVLSIVARVAEALTFQDAMNKVTRRQLPTVDILYGSEDNMEGFRAFAEKRDPVWKGK